MTPKQAKAHDIKQASSHQMTFSVPSQYQRDGETSSDLLAYRFPISISNRFHANPLRLSAYI